MGKTFTSVGITDALFNAPIGWFPEERILKNDLLVSVYATYILSEKLNGDELNATIDYMQLHKICEKVLKKEAKLLETAAQQIMDRALELFPQVQSLQVTIKKLNPPVKAQIKHSFVQLNFENSDEI